MNDMNTVKDDFLEWLEEQIGPDAVEVIKGHELMGLLDVMNRKEYNAFIKVREEWLKNKSKEGNCN